MNPHHGIIILWGFVVNKQIRQFNTSFEASNSN